MIASLLSLALPLATAESPGLALVHVEANVGGASGGHLALRHGDQAWHFQHAEGGVLRLVRTEWSAFRHLYAGLENRSLHLAWIDAAPQDVERVALRLSRLYVEQEGELDRVARAWDDARWWSALRDGTRPPPLRGVGFFERPERSAAGGPGDASRVEGAHSLRDAVAADLGASWCGHRLVALEHELAGWRPHAQRDDLQPFRERLLEREALHALEHGWPLDPLTWFELDPGDEAPLDVAERVGLERVRDAQLAAIVALLRSARPDRGFALLVAIARHRAASRSLAAGRLVLLDAFPDDAPFLEVEDDAARAAFARVAARTAATARAARREVLAEGDYDESRFNLLEELASRLHGVRGGAAGLPVRLRTGRLVPSRGARVDARLEAADAAARAERARARARRLEDGLRKGRRYALLSRNCVTELARVLDEAFPDAAAAERALGGRLAAGEAAGFVPFVLHERAIERLRVSRVETIPSHRLEELARLRDADPRAIVALREATTLGSTIYSPRDADGAFLFFTDDVRWLRPVHGAMNVAWGLGHGLTGVFTAPFDAGRRARAGFHGVFFSLPELAFGNVRKGSFADVGEPPAVR